jgi:hypothetical protein
VVFAPIAKAFSSLALLQKHGRPVDLRTALRQSVGEIEKRPSAPSAPQNAIDISDASKMSYYAALKIGGRLQ